jgi:hypothetical protein
MNEARGLTFEEVGRTLRHHLPPVPPEQQLADIVPAFNDDVPAFLKRLKEAEDRFRKTKIIFR